MAAIPGINGDIYFGTLDGPPPDWRAAISDDEDDSDEDDSELLMQDEEYMQDLVNRLGFDPTAKTDDDEEV